MFTHLTLTVFINVSVGKNYMEAESDFALKSFEKNERALVENENKRVHKMSWRESNF